MRRASTTGFKTTTNRRRSSAIHGTSTSAAGRRCSLTTFTASSRIRSNSKAFVGDDEIELCQPPLEDLPRVPGYEDVTFEPYTVPPPAVPIVTEVDEDENEDNKKRKPLKTIPALLPIDARDILIRYADSRCIFNKDAARDMKITSFCALPRYKYTLESFAESRQVAWTFEAYSGDSLDVFSSSQPAPSAWSIEVPLPKLFQIHTATETVPHTDVLMTCHACGGVGSKRCNACSAAGWERCSVCLGDGHKISLQGQRERCFRCLGTGRKKCWKCAGDTIAVCRGCGGTGQIRCYIALTVNWTNHVDSLTVDTPEALASIQTAKMSSKLEFAKGIIVFDEELPMVNPVVFPNNEELHSFSASRIEKHKDLLETEKIIVQRHSICTIPVFCATYEWKHKQRIFFVYGAQNEVYAPDYPEELCCCCNIM